MEYTDAARARIALSQAAKELAEDTRHLIDTQHEERHDAIRELLQAVDNLAGQLEMVRRLAVVYARQRAVPWEEIDQNLTITGATAQERYAEAITDWEDALYDPARHRYEWLPDGAYNPAEVVDELDTWLAADAESARRGYSVSAGLPVYNAMTRTSETLARARWLSGKLRHGGASEEALADHQRRKADALTAAQLADIDIPQDDN